MARRRVQRTSAANRDLANLAEYISRDDPAAAIRFLDAAEATASTLLEADGLGSLCEFADPRTEGMRVWPIKGFRNHLIFYRPVEEGIQIVRVLHSARDLNSIFGESAAD